MQRKMSIVLAFALVVATVSTSHAFAADLTGPAAVPSCKVLTATAGTAQGTGELDGFLANLVPAGEQKTSCPAPYCVTNHDCAIRPPGDANSTCVYGKIGTPAGCGYCYY